MSVTIRLPGVLAQNMNTGLRHETRGETLREALESLFTAAPGLRHHLLDEQGEIRPHVLVFVDAARADLDAPLRRDSEIQVLQAVSGG